MATSAIVAQHARITLGTWQSPKGIVPVLITREWLKTITLLAEAVDVLITSAGVTSFAFTDGNGFTGTVLNPTTTPTLSLAFTGILDVTHGGTGTATPSLVAGTNVTITGTWPNQTINSSGGSGGSGTVTMVAKGAGWGGLGGVAITTGSGTDYQLVPRFLQACTLTAVEIKTLGGTGSCVIDIFKSTYAGLPAITSICASTLPTISSGTKYQDTTLTSWTTAMAVGDELTARLVSSSIFTQILITISFTVP